MKNACKQFVEWLESEGTNLPPNLMAHRELCPECQREYEMECAYQRVLDTVRSEPVPTTNLQWSHIADKLNQPAKQARPRLAWRPLWAPALAFGVMVGLGLLFWMNSPNERTELAQVAKGSESGGAVMMRMEALPPDTAVSSDGEVSEPSAPVYSDTVKPFAGAEEEPNTLRLEARIPSSSPEYDMVPRRQELAMAPSETARPSARNGEPALRTAPVALQTLELEPIIPQGSENAEYLPVQYSSEPSATEAQANDAIICSF